MSDSPLKVCHVVTAFPRHDNDDAITPWQVALLLAQQRRGIDVSVFAPAWRDLGDHNVFSIPVKRFRYCVGALQRFSHENAFPAQLRRNPLYAALAVIMLIAGALALPRYVRKNRIDIVHVHWPLPMALLTIFLV